MRSNFSQKEDPSCPTAFELFHPANVSLCSQPLLLETENYTFILKTEESHCIEGECKAVFALLNLSQNNSCQGPG